MECLTPDQCGIGHDCSPCYQKEIQRLTQEKEALQKRFDELKAIYVKLTNSEHVVNDFGEIVGYVATHNILHEIEKLVEQSNENSD